MSHLLVGMLHLGWSPCGIRMAPRYQEFAWFL